MTDRKATFAIRVSPNLYVTAIFVALFFAAFCVYLEWDRAAAALAVFGFGVLPVLAFTDRVAFDGRRLRRTGLLPRFWAWVGDYHYRLKISDIEQIETQSLRALKRGGNVFYRYRTSFTGRGLRFAIASGGEDYRRMVREIFPRVSEDILDNRSIELRDYLSEPKEVLMKAEFVHIPSAEVLEESVRDFRVRPERRSAQPSGDQDKARELRRIANELRLSGYLIQALEAFRRALLITPRDNWLLFEFARCLNSYAAAERDERLQRRAFASLRLAEMRADGDGELLARVGESYFQFGDWRRAQNAFQKSLGLIEASFRAARGLAEIALREGKIAHVIHNFAAAHRVAETPALRRWTQSEAEYFNRLNDDEEYMELEIGRIQLLETLERSKRTALRVGLIGFPMILVGVILDDQLIANVGWAVSSLALLIWIVLIGAINIFSVRAPLDIAPDD